MTRPGIEPSTAQPHAGRSPTPPLSERESEAKEQRPENAATWSAHHFQGLLPVEHAVDVADDLANVVVGNLAGPACADAFRPVDEQCGDDGDVPLWLHTLVVIKVVLEQVVVYRWEQKAGQGAAGTATTNKSVHGWGKKREKESQ